MSPRSNTCSDMDDFYLSRLAFCSELKNKGLTDQYIMEVVALLQNDAVFDVVREKFNTEGYDFDEDITEEEIVEIVQKAYGGVVPSSTTRGDNYSITDKLYPAHCHGSKARFLNLLEYLDGSRIWNPRYDAEWRNDLKSAEVAEAAIALMEVVPELTFLDGERFQQQTIVEQARTLASLADEVVALSQNGNVFAVQEDREFDPVSVFQQLGKPFGIGRGRVKRDYAIVPLGAEETSLPEQLVVTEKLRDADFVYVNSVDALRLALRRGCRRFAATKDIFSYNSVKDFVRGWVTAVYKDGEHEDMMPISSQPTVDPNATVVSDLIKKFKGRKAIANIEEAMAISRAQHPEPVEEEKVVEEQHHQPDPEQVKLQITAVPNVALYVYHKCKTGPGKEYYLAKVNRRNTFALHARLKNEIDFTVKKADVAPMGPAPQKQVPKPALTKLANDTAPYDPDEIYSVIYNRTTIMSLLREKKITKMDYSLSERLKSGNQNSIIKMVRAKVGAISDRNEFAQALVMETDAKLDGKATAGAYLVVASMLMSGFSVVDGDIIRN